MSTVVRTSAEMSARFRGATDRGEVVLHFQPQVALRSGRIVAVEALARWRTASLDLVPTEHFVRIAEENGQIVEFGQWVLRTACAQLRRWQDDGLPPLRVAVNLSAKQLLDDAFMAAVAHTIESTGVEPSSVEFELTEGQITVDLDQAARTLTALRNRGMRVAIDDFGTGFSSLSQLKRLPIDSIKLDQSFIRDIPGNVGDAKIIAAVIALAHSLDLEVTAEGVESRAQLAFLRDHGCDVIQGYLLSRPMSAESCAGWIRSFQPVDPSFVV